MTYRGKVQNGVVVLDRDAKLPEGTVVAVEPIPARADEDLDPVFLMDELAVDTGIPDLAANADHYLYGHPKEERNAR